MKYDYIIVGAGISGLYSAYKLLKKNNKLNILLIESQTRIGGRCETISFKDTDGTQIQYESGGARFSNKHTKLVKLLKELDLYNDKIKIPSKVNFMTYPNNLYKQYKHEFKSLDDVMLKINNLIKKNNISDSILRNTTLCKLSEKYFNKYFPKSKYNISFSNFLIDYFEYWSEFSTLNALDALSLFTNEFKQSIQYYILKNGYSSIINSLFNKCKKYTGFKFKNNSSVSSIKKILDQYIISYINITNNKLHTVNVNCNKIILAIPINNLHNIKIDINNINLSTNYNKLLSLLNKNIKTAALYRIYARYPNYYHEINTLGNTIRINNARITIF